MQEQHYKIIKTIIGDAWEKDSGKMPKERSIQITLEYIRQRESEYHFLLAAYLGGKLSGYNISMPKDYPRLVINGIVSNRMSIATALFVNSIEQWDIVIYTCLKLYKEKNIQFDLSQIYTNDIKKVIQNLVEQIYE